MTKSKPIQNQSPVLILLMGLPASGKSTFAKLLQEFLSFESQFESIGIIDIDQIREEKFGKVFNPEKEPEVQNEKFQRVTHELHPNNLVIVDDLHYYISMRHRYHELAKKMQGIYIPIYFSTPMRICEKWNTGRGTPIPNHLIHEINKKFDEPGLKYKWDTPKLEINFNQLSLEAAIDIAVKNITLELEKCQVASSSGLHGSGKTLNEEGQQRQREKNHLEIEWRGLIRNIFTKKIAQPHLEQLDQWLKSNRNVSLSSLTAPKALSDLRKKFFGWKKLKEIDEISIVTFLEFITNTF